MIQKEVQTLIEQAIDVLLKKDAVLFQIDEAERTIAAKLACYIQAYFPDWNVDCEYNRHNIHVKRLKKICYSSNNENGSSVYPDIIIHRRMTKENLLVIEIKKTTNDTSDDCDMQKLEAFINELGYQQGLFIRFKAGAVDVGVEYMIWM